MPYIMTFTTRSNSFTADLVQDMYLKELKAYKVPPMKASDAKGHVHEFKMPAPPQSPEETDIQNDLKAYEEQVPEVEGQAASGDSAEAVEQDWFEEPEEDDEEAEHH